MAINNIKTKHGKIYRAVLYRHRKKLAQKHFERKIDAQKWLEQKEQQYHLGYQKITFKQAVLNWLENHSKIKKTPASFEGDQRMIHGQFIPFFGDRMLEEITPDDIERLITHLKLRQTKNATINRYLQCLRTIFYYHIRKRHLFYNAVSLVGLLPEDEADYDFLNFAEVEKFLSYSKAKHENKKDWVYRLYLLAISTGLRWGEIIGLKWDKVDFNLKRITVSRSYCDTTGQLRETTKGRKIRHLGINSSLIPELLAHYEMRNRNHDLVFFQENSNPLEIANFKRDFFHRDLKEAGLRKIKFHELRHTFASHFVMRNGNLYDLQKLLGHSSIKTTERYAHLLPESVVHKTELVAIYGINRVVEIDKRREHFKSASFLHP